MSYRVEVSVSNRAVCAATQCKNDKIKIAKGELRHGTLVITPDFQSMKWRHWGCVTPTVLHNWWETAGQNVDMIDGFDELPGECQAKVKTALEIGHVADDEWNGDVECNRYDPNNKAQGMFLKGQRLRDKQAAEAAANGEELPAKPASKKRDRAAADDDDEAEASPTKKAKAKKTKAEADEDEDMPSTKKTKSKAVKKEPDEDEGTAPAKKSKSKAVKKEAIEDETPQPTKKSKAEPVKSEADEDEVVPTTKKAKSKAKAAKTEADEDAAPAPTKKSKAKAVKSDVDQHEDGPVNNKSKKGKTKDVDANDSAAVPVKTKGRGKNKPAANSGELLEDTEPAAKTTKRKKSVKSSD